MSRAPRHTDSAPDWRTLGLVAAGLAAVTLVVYWQVAGFRFLSYDDRFYVTNNRQVRGGLSWPSIQWAWTSMRAFWHPLTWLSHMLDWQLYGEQSAGHHVTNLAWHVAGGMAALVAWYRLTGRLWPAALVAALFLLHPLRTESVAWVAERKGLLSALAWMLGLWAYAEYARRPSFARYAVVFIALSVGLLCKPSLVTFPLALLLLDLWPLARWRPRWLSADAAGAGSIPTASLGWLLLEKLPLLGLAVAAGAVAIHAEQQFGALEWLPGLTLASRVKNALIVPWLYLGKFIWPVDLAFFYRHPGNAISTTTAALAAGGLVAVTAGCLLQLRRRPYLLVGWLWFLGTLAPVSGLVQIGGHRMADRYADIPLVGIYAALAAGLAELVARRPALRDLVFGCLLLALLALAAASFRQAGFWRNDESLLEHALAVDPDNWVALTNRARRRIDQGQLDEAIADCRRAWQVQPNSAIASNLADALLRQGHPDEALPWVHKAIELDPSIGPHHMQLAMTLAKLGRDAEAETSFHESVRLAPREIVVLRNYAVFLGQRRRLDEAAAMFRRLLEVDPASTDDYQNLAKTLIAAGDYVGATQALSEALARSRRLAAAYLLRADVLARQGRAAEALADYKRGGQLPPSSILRVIWILAADPSPENRDPPQAVALAEQLAATTGHRDAAALDALAMAYASVGRFDDAARVARDAADLARRNGQPKLAALIEGRQALYRIGQPFTAPFAELATFWDSGGG